jgi:polysaccharide deacetylase family protein (PEP-CTERM system associated)
VSGNGGLRHVLSVDVEDWDQLVRRRFVGRLLPPTSRPVANTHTLLELFARRGVRATFFVLGLVAEAYPALVREIAAAGHEVGTHGYSHRLVYELGPERFRAELRRSVQLLADLTGQPVLSHRAAEFSITPRASWAWEILAEEGIHYDSSIFPIHHPRYGWPGAPTAPYRVVVNGASIWECPLPTIRVGRWNLPVGGGGYLRLFPYAFTRRALRAIAASGRPIVIYLHPHEFDPAPLRLAHVPKSGRLHLFEFLQNVNRGTVARRRTSRLLRELPLAPLKEVAQSWPKT